MKRFLTVLATLALASLFNGRYVAPWLPVPDGMSLLTLALIAYLSIVFASLGRFDVRFRWQDVVIISSVITQAILLLISLVWTPAPSYGALKAQAFLLLSLAPTMLFYLARHWLVVNGHLLLWCFSLPGLVYAIALLFTGDLNESRVAAFNWNPIRGSQYMLTCFLIMLANVFANRRVAVRFLLGLSLVLVLVGAFLSGSRGPLVAVSIPTLVVVYYMGIRSPFPRMASLRPGTVVGMLGIIVLLAGTISVGYGQQALKRFSFSFMQHDSNVITRLEYWRESLVVLGDTKLLGLGVGGFGYHWTGTDMREYPHNIVMEMLAEIGVVGGSCFAVYVVTVVISAFDGIKKMLRYRYSRHDLLPPVLAVSLFLFSLLNAMTTGDLIENSSVWVHGVQAVILSRRVHRQAVWDRADLKHDAHLGLS